MEIKERKEGNEIVPYANSLNGRFSASKQTGDLDYLSFVLCKVTDEEVP